MSNRLLLSGSGRLQPQQFMAAAETGPWPMIRTAWRRHCSRRRIAGLDSDALKDIGITYAEAEAEANKPFWRP